MEELDFDHRLQWDEQADKNLVVRFFRMPVRNDTRSREEGRAIFDDVEMIEIRVRGDRNNIVVHPIREDEKVRFAKAYDQFRRGVEATQEGTPLSEWPIMSTSMVEELKYLGFVTVEQLAEASDTVCSKFAGLLTWKQKAKAFIEFAKGISPLERMQEQLATMQDQAQVSANQVREMAQRYEELDRRYRDLLERVASGQEVSEAPITAAPRVDPRK